MTFDCILLHTHTHITQHSDDDIEVRSVRLADSGSFVDQDDEVVDVLEDKETVGTHPHMIPLSLHLHWLVHD